MKTLSKIMEGKKTITGLILIAAGFLGFGDVVSEAEMAQAIDIVVQFAGLCLSLYGYLVTKRGAK